MRLTSYEKDVRREIERWERGESSILMQAMNWAMKPVDYVVDRVAPPEVVDQAGRAVEDFLSVLNNASEWTYDTDDLLERARKHGIDVERIEDLRDQPLDELDPFARSLFAQNAVLAAIEGGGTGLGGVFLMAADLPLLFTINFRLIQQIGAAYGFSMRGPAYRPIILSIYNVAASSGRDAKHAALREMSVAAASFAGDLEYRGRISGTFREQNRHLPREIAKNLVGRKLGQTIPVIGAAVGAGVNYWFTTETAQAAYMLFRALFLEWKDRR